MRQATRASCGAAAARLARSQLRAAEVPRPPIVQTPTAHGVTARGLASAGAAPLGCAAPSKFQAAMQSGWSRSCSTQRRGLTTFPLERYEQLAATGEIFRDPNQERTVAMLDGLAKRLQHYKPKPSAPVAMAPAAAPPQQNGRAGGLFGGFFNGGSSKPSQKAPAPVRLLPSGPKGLYVWGGCGTGKTFLMDLFYDHVPVERKKRIHFHEWMIDVHERLTRLQKKNAMVQDKANTVWTAEAALAQQKELKKGGRAAAGDSSANDLVLQVATEMMREAWLLCFDEFQVTHISDAIIMKRLFSVMFEQGAVVVATSNRPPEDLYLNGLNRPLFLPFIPMLKDFCDVHDIASEVDYRRTGTEDEDRRVYIHPNGKEQAKLLERKFYRLAMDKVVTGGQVETQGRRINVPKAAESSQIAWFNFKDLCDKPLGAGDYLALASAYHTVFVANIPKLTMQERDQVRRFITMIDAFYERKTKLVCTAELDPISLFQVTADERNSSSADEIFAWDRTASRLIEMQSVKYLSEVARLLDSEQFLGQFNLRALLDEELAEIWRRYDQDDSGNIDEAELRFFLGDIVEKHKGHRNVPDDVVAECLDTMDLDKNGVISYDEFAKSLRDFDNVSTAIRI